MKIPINDPKHWQEHADEARTVFNQLTDPDSKRNMRLVVQGYEQLARRAEERLNK